MAGSFASAGELLASSLIFDLAGQGPFEIESRIFQVAAVRPLSHRHQPAQNGHVLWRVHGRTADNFAVAQPDHAEATAADIAAHDLFDPRKRSDDLQVG